MSQPLRDVSHVSHVGMEWGEVGAVLVEDRVRGREYALEQ